MADNERDEHGRFAAGNHPVTGFHTNPERRGRFPGNRHSFSKAAQRLLDMTDSQLEAERKLFCFNVCSTGSAVFFRSVG